MHVASGVGVVAVWLQGVQRVSVAWHNWLCFMPMINFSKARRLPAATCLPR